MPDIKSKCIEVEFPLSLLHPFNKYSACPVGEREAPAFIRENDGRKNSQYKQE